MCGRDVIKRGLKRDLSYGNWEGIWLEPGKLFSKVNAPAIVSLIKQDKYYPSDYKYK